MQLNESKTSLLAASVVELLARDAEDDWFPERLRRWAKARRSLEVCLGMVGGLEVVGGDGRNGDGRGGRGVLIKE